MNSTLQALRGEAALFNEAIRDPLRAQTALLTNLLAKNKSTIFGAHAGFAKIGSLSDFQKAVPVSTYADFRDAIDQIARGETNPLFAEKCVFIAKTSGTTGRPKLIPFPENIGGEYRAFISPMLFALESQFPGAVDAGFCLSGKFLEEVSAGGIPMGQSTAFVRRVYGDYSYFACAPEEVFEETIHELRYFLLAAFALLKPLKVISSLNPSTLLTVFKIIETHGPALERAIREGRLLEGPDGFEKYSAAFAKAAGAGNSSVAGRLKECLRARGRPLASQIWPTLKVVQTWQGGSAKHYLESLLEYCPGTLLWPMVSGSSEAALLVPMNGDCSGGVPALRSTFFEYIEEDSDPKLGPYLSVSDLELGKNYRTIITNSRGLYRLAMEDVFKVEAFHEKVPVLSFLHRVGNTSSLTGEKLSEKDVVFALTEAQSQGAVKAVAFQVAPEWGEPPRYVLLAELKSGGHSQAELQQFAERFEQGLFSANTEYEAKRRSGRLGKLLLCILEENELDRIKATKAAATGRSDIQLKIPVLTKNLVDLKTFRIRAKIGASGN